MKKLCYSACLLACSVLFIVSCSDGTVGDTFAEDQYSSRGTLITYANVVNGFFDLGDQDNSFVSMDLDSEGEPASSVNINIAYGGNETQLTSVSGLPANVTITMNEALAALGLTAADVAIGDQVSLTFDGVSGGGTYRSSNSVNVPFSCFSGLAGTYDYVSTNFAATSPYAGPCPAMATGTVTWTDQGGGVYLTSDLGFGQYESACWSDGPATSANATFSDVCNKITTGGADQYALVYFWVINGVSGADLDMSWSNNYGDSGDVIVTRPDGSDWPPLFTE